jgi:glycosyltransferase involved in cell wall biosynthesis
MTKKLKIGLIMQGGRDWIGGSYYIKNIMFALSSLPEEVRETFEICLLYQGKKPSRESEDRVNSNDIIYSLETDLLPFTFTNRLKSRFMRTFWNIQNPRIPMLFENINLDFIYPYLVPTEEKRLSYNGCPWIPDFQHKYQPELFQDSEINARDNLFSQIANSSSRVVLSSETAAKDFQEFFPRSKCNPEILQFRTSLAANCYTRNTIEFLQKYHLPERFFLISNQFWQHKNHMMVFEALKILQSSSIYPVVVCTGHVYDYRKPDYIDIILQAISTYGLANQVYLLGLIPRIDQLQLMRHSLAIVQPSLFEGWSTVIEDARCLGKKMILSDFPVHLEQNPPEGVFFERNSPQQLANLIAAWWEKSPPGVNLEAETIAREENGANVQKFGYRFLEIAKS